MAQTEYREVLGVDKDKLYSVIVQYENYPQFVEGCTAVKVGERKDGKVRVSYEVNVMSQNVTYTLDHREDPQAGKVEWNLVESNFFKKNSGSWIVKSTGQDKTETVYDIEVEFKVPVP